MKILIVDDDPKGLYMLKTILKAHGYEIMTAKNGRIALESARANPPDRIISDILMPVMDGYSLCEECKKDSKLKSIPFIFYTATYTDPGDEEYALSLGAERFIVKPVEPEKFIEIMDEVVRTSKSGKSATGQPKIDETAILKGHYERMAKKLEDKMLQLSGANKKLSKSEKKYRALFETAEDAIFVADKTGRFVEVNQAACGSLGYSKEELLRLNIGEIDADSGGYESFWKLWNGQMKHVTFEMNQQRKNGTLLPVEISGTFFTSNGQQISLAIARDITKRKQREEELRKYREHLEDVVKERTRQLEKKAKELERVNIRLQEMDRLKSIFLAGMSHELRTPLNSIMGFTDIMLMGMAGEITEEQRKQLAIVKSSARHLLELISDLLDISRIESEKIELLPAEFGFNEVISEVVEIISPAINEKGLKLIIKVTEGATLFSDRRRIKQVLINLINNAVKFTDSGKITLTAGLSESSKLKVQRKSGFFQLPASDFELHRDWLVISVRDTGIGIKHEDMNKLFQPFQQVNTDSVRIHKGTGLGLYLCKKLVTLLGGDIWAKSKYGSGSEFVFAIPLRNVGI